jgi:hypothetical protein
MTDVPENATSVPPGDIAPPETSVSIQFYRDLKNDYTTLLNNGIWNFGMLYGFYAIGGDEYLFSTSDSDMMVAAKMSVLIAGLNETNRAVKKNLATMGVPVSILYPFKPSA